MSIASEVSRIKAAKANIITAINNKGGSVPASAAIDELASAINGLSTGSSGGGQSFQMDSGTTTGSGNTFSLTLDFVPQLVNLVVRRSSNNNQFVVAYNAQTGVVWQSNDSGGYHTNTTASVSGNTVTFNLKTNADANMSITGNVLWSAAGYTA